MANLAAMADAQLEERLRALAVKEEAAFRAWASIGKATDPAAKNKAAAKWSAAKRAVGAVDNALYIRRLKEAS